MDDAVRQALARYWGYSRLRPLQHEAVQAGLGGRDSLVVMPTGGGKSLCYQLPPVVAGRVDVVVSPLISLMKDQVDGLLAAGYPAAALHSGLTPAERLAVERGIEENRYALIYAAPERVLTPAFVRAVQRIGVRSFAIDEAHCISQWGHDFRPEYRRLAQLRDLFPSASLHAFTATATPRVREDIAQQLRLREPRVLVGGFDRPNLTYRVLPQHEKQAQTIEIIRRHKGEAAIVYCLSRNDTEAMAAALRGAGLNAAHYHAGMDPAERRQTQERFANEELDVVAATVAFGMGIDRSDVRCIVHAGLPKSIEAYQQETGRAGRDGLPAQCVLLYSPNDVRRLERLIHLSAQDAQDPQAVIAAQLDLLREMQRYCSAQRCRHRILSEYFGQAYESPNCAACDLCLNELEHLEDGTVAAQKVLSCVARAGPGFGVGHVVDILLGADNARIRSLDHHRLSTYGLLKGLPRREVQHLTHQLIDQGLLDHTGDPFPVLHLNAHSWEVMRGKRTVRLLRAKRKLAQRPTAPAGDAGLQHPELFESLRAVRKRLAEERGVPPFVILHDTTLRELARLTPTTPEQLRQVRGIGERKATDLGPTLIAAIQAHLATPAPPGNP